MALKIITFKAHYKSLPICIFFGIVNCSKWLVFSQNFDQKDYLIPYVIYLNSLIYSSYFILKIWCPLNSFLKSGVPLKTRVHIHFKTLTSFPYCHFARYLKTKKIVDENIAYFFSATKILWHLLQKVGLKVEMKPDDTMIL